LIKVIILDLDDTLLDTQALKPLRDSGRWREISQHLESCSVHDDVLGLLNTARSVGIKIAVFTNAPSNYVQTLLRHFNIVVDFLVAYHDVENHKPHPEGIDIIFSHFNVSKDETIYVGDSDLDRDAAMNAGVEFFAVEWGSATHVDQENIGVLKLSELIGNNFSHHSSAGFRSELLISDNKFYLGYYLEGIKQEVWSFKDGADTAIRRWSGKVVELAEYFPKIDVVVRALGHAELNAVEKEMPLDILSANLAEALDAQYQPSVLKKSKKLAKSTSCTAAERANQVKGVYSVISEELTPINSESLTFLIVDDVYTSGSTTNEISRALFEAYPQARVYIFTLVKTIYRSEANKSSAEIQHNTQLFSDLYDVIERREAKEAEPRSVKGKFVTKKLSANYARTNHNFVFHNLPKYSIASEPDSGDLFCTVQILKNMLQRGKPTIASRQLRAACGLAFSESGINLEPLALIANTPIEWQRLIRGEKKSGRYPAKVFFDELLAKYLGKYSFVKQLIVPEVQIFDMTQVYVDQYQNRQVDFFIPQAGVIIEIDGAQHQDSRQTDQARDSFTETLGLKTFRFTSAEIASENGDFVNKMESLHSYIERIYNLECQDVITPPNGIKLLDYEKGFLDGLNPSDSRVRLTAAIRFQLLLLELIERGALRLGEKTRLFVVNHDNVEFIWDAIVDLNELLENIFCLQGINKGLLDLEVKELKALPTDRNGTDLIIDFSVFRRYDDSHQVNEDVIFSRTDYFDFYRYFSDGDALSIEQSILTDYDYFRLSCARPVAYNLDLSPDSMQRESLRFFLSNLFLPFVENVDFREGQVGIIGSALSRNGTIGLLPTGSGKSICYQLSALLQPAVSFVVCPIKSLMYDQKSDLDAIGFTRSNYITGDLNPDEKARIQRDFGCGKYFFVFISPERFQTDPFRREMSSIGLDLAFAYAVIDEAHCLSEWGHDFRTSYLNLASTIEKFAPSANYIGLTATASVNVLKDIQAEFNIPDDYVRTPLDFSREELAFHVIDDQGRKGEAVIQLVSEMERKWNQDKQVEPKAGIIFTATVNGNKGCHSLAGRLSSELDMDVRYFSGSAPRYGNLQGNAFNDYKRQVQDDFKENKYRLLAATKAFGMGVNKGNVAYTVHFGIPGSMEALYQEAGRAGRDKALFKKVPADCYVLLTKEPNTELLDKIWAPSTSVTDLKGHVKALSRDSDLNTNMFLMTNGLDTINDDFKLIAGIYAFLRQYSDRQSVTVSARQFRSDKSKFEKAIYRLSQLGIVLDWVIKDFFNGILQVEFQCLTDDQLVANIERTIRKYNSSFKLDDAFESESEYYKVICEKLNKGSIDKVQFVFLVLLLWSYDHFVYNRRQSQKNVYEQCIDVASGKMAESEFKDKLEGYFKFNQSSQLLLHLAENTADTSLWLSVFYGEPDDAGHKQLVSSREVTVLGGQLSRFLESYKDNACLNYLSGVIRLTADQFDDTDGERRMASSFDQLLDDSKEVALSLVRETLGLSSLFSKNARSRYARLVHEKFDDLCLLEEVNEVFEDSYSYHTLLLPLASRLEKLTNSYKGIDW
jgi:ATP-dependent DNA helicase RecQ